MYLVVDDLDQKERVVKLVPWGSKDAAAREKVRGEGRALAGCKHPNVLALHEVAENDEFYCLVTEHCAGGDLEDMITADALSGTSDLEKNLVLFAQTCLAVQYLHAKGVLHRDIKTANVLLTSRGIVKLADFGIATQLEGTAMASTMCGTPFSFSPELCEGKEYNEKADVWALGIVLFELLYPGRKPFQGNNLMALVNGILHTPVVELRPEETAAQRDDPRRELVWDLVVAMLSHDPAQRPDVTEILNHPVIRQCLKTFLASLKSTLEKHKERRRSNAAGSPGQSPKSDSSVISGTPQSESAALTPRATEMFVTKVEKVEKGAADVDQVAPPVLLREEVRNGELMVAHAEFQREARRNRERLLEAMRGEIGSPVVTEPQSSPIEIQPQQQQPQPPTEPPLSHQTFHEEEALHKPEAEPLSKRPSEKLLDRESLHEAMRAEATAPTTVDTTQDATQEEHSPPDTDIPATSDTPQPEDGLTTEGDDDDSSPRREVGVRGQGGDVLASSIHTAPAEEKPQGGGGNVITTEEEGSNSAEPEAEVKTRRPDLEEKTLPQGCDNSNTATPQPVHTHTHTPAAPSPEKASTTPTPPGYSFPGVVEVKSVVDVESPASKSMTKSIGKASDAKTPTKSISTVKMSDDISAPLGLAKLCQHCTPGDAQEATCLCVDCEQALCSVCSMKVHAQRDKAGHRVTLLSTGHEPLPPNTSTLRPATSPSNEIPIPPAAVRKNPNSPSSPDSFQPPQRNNFTGVQLEGKDAPRKKSSQKCCFVQ